MNTEVGNYRHTQKGPWSLLLYVLGVVFLVISWSVPLLPLQITFLVTGILMFLLGMSFHYLTVADEGSHFAICFGPFPLFRKRIDYDDISAVEKGRTTIFDGWGIHLSLRGGWVWNIWGRDCVVIHLKRGIVRVGTDDTDGLLAVLKDRIEGRTRWQSAGGLTKGEVKEG
jgi:hypothetical protein